MDEGDGLKHVTINPLEGGDQLDFINYGWMLMLPCLEPGVSVLVVGESYVWGGRLRAGGRGAKHVIVNPGW